MMDGKRKKKTVGKSMGQSLLLLPLLPGTC
jgi:hypothetical protein